MQKAAIYARYSTEEQRATSIEDQVRRTREKAESLGYEVPDDLIFSDAIITGTAKGLAKRVGYQRLLRAWDNKEFDALIVDEVCRLAREPVALANLQVRIENTKVRLVSTDGIDSAVPGWQLQFGFCGVIASHFVRETGHRVIRGMIGQLERGFMIAAPPFGYESVRQGEEGTNWLIVEENAKHVRNIFQQRRKGASLNAIAKSLNEQGLASPRISKNGTIRYWRPGTVRQMLRNTIYRGLFVWNGSPFSKAKEKRGETVLQEMNYLRPQLRLIDDDTWFFCNQEGKGSIVRGGDKHVFAGLVSCGTCNAKLTVATGGSSPSLYCAQCAQAEAAAVVGRVSAYVSAKGLEAVLIQAIEKLFSGHIELMFKEKLRARLEGGQEQEIVLLNQKLLKKEKSLKTLLRLLSSSETEDPAAEIEYRQVLNDKHRLASELARLETAWSTTDIKAIERQLETNPRKLLPRLFSGEVPTEETRAALRRLFPKIIFGGKLSRFCSLFSIECAPGVTLAEVSGTHVIDNEVVNLEFCVTGGSKRPSTWLVEEMGINN